MLSRAVSSNPEPINMRPGNFGWLVETSVHGSSRELSILVTCEQLMKKLVEVKFDKKK